MKVDGGKRLYRRPTYAGNAFSWLEIATPVQVVSVRQTEFTAAEPSGGASPVESAARAPRRSGGRAGRVPQARGRQERAARTWARRASSSPAGAR